MEIQFDRLEEEFRDELAEHSGVVSSQMNFEMLLVKCRMNTGTVDLKLPIRIVSRLREIYDEAQQREIQKRLTRSASV